MVDADPAGGVLAAYELVDAKPTLIGTCDAVFTGGCTATVVVGLSATATAVLSTCVLAACVLAVCILAVCVLAVSTLVPVTTGLWLLLATGGADGIGCPSCGALNGIGGVTYELVFGVLSCANSTVVLLMSRVLAEINRAKRIDESSDLGDDLVINTESSPYFILGSRV